MSGDGDLWQAYAKTVKKIGKAAAAKISTSFPRKQESIARDSVQESSRADARSWIPAFAGMTCDNAAPTKLDRRAEKNLRLGDITLDARIDLHGMTQPEAHDALARFMAVQVKTGKRNLLIITGKGRGGDGVLRTNLPTWLHALPEARQILGLRPAAPKHGGSGAFYVLLKKKKPI